MIPDYFSNASIRLTFKKNDLEFNTSKLWNFQDLVDWKHRTQSWYTSTVKVSNGEQETSTMDPYWPAPATL